jgi:dihydropteroate synthase
MSSLTIDSRTFTWGECTYVMGILNITPDSFSGDGLLSFSLPPLPVLGEGEGAGDGGEV